MGGGKIDEDGLGVTDMEIPVGFRRKTGVDGHALVLPAGGEILVDEFVNEILAHGLTCHKSHSFILCASI
ncbi:hypothetical protein SDC9_87977 [bioreactor metagenome]|uniref:Uncharacterized protein n=1 Tax=bioreactor metagenome TaxID=1076179 RepID=A0A644ZKB1_9ZZZZ